MARFHTAAEVPGWITSTRLTAIARSSDAHLGTPDARGEYLLHFLESIDCDYFVLNGDLLDVWNMQRRLWHRSPATTRLFQQLLRPAAVGTEVIYVPGNHDECFRDYVGQQSFAGVRLYRQWRHALADGRTALILHSDEFDGAMSSAPLTRLAGNLGYEFLHRLDRLSRWPRHRLGRGHWSLCRYVKSRIPGPLGYVRQFEQAAVAHGATEGVDVVICGHMHHANLFEQGGVTYANSGDWVEHCTALVEHHGGRLEILDWGGGGRRDSRGPIGPPAEAGEGSDRAAACG